MPTLNRRKDSPTTHRQGRNNRAFYQSARWHRLSLQFRKANPLCAKCLKEGHTRLGQCADHVIPLVQWTGDPYAVSNLQTLCKSCHSKKTINERKG